MAVAFFGVLHRALAHSNDLVAPMAGARGWLLFAAALFVVAAFTDTLDGFLARRWNAVTTFGRVMDPFADKVLVLGAFVYLAAPGFQLADPAVAAGPALQPAYQATGVAPWMVVLILARELLVTSIRGLYESQGVDFSAMWSGKAKMVLQSLVVPVILVLVALVPVDPGSWGFWVIRALVWITLLVTVASGLQYVARAARGPKRDQGVDLLLATTLGLGYMRPAPGTWGSMPVPILVGLLWLAGVVPVQPDSAAGASSSIPWIAYHAILLAVLLTFSIACIAAGPRAEARFGRKDPSEVVADETAGQVIPLLFLPAWVWQDLWTAAGAAVAAFLLFRALDIIKLPPASQLQRLPAGWGILIDDLVAGAQALIIMQLLTRLIL